MHAARVLGCAQDQVSNFYSANVFLQERQLAASAAARLCDLPDGPTAIGYGGARGGGKSHWLLAQMGADDCQRYPGLKCLYLRKIGKKNLEHFDDLRRKLFRHLEHDFSPSRGVLTFANGSEIHNGHFQTEGTMDDYTGLEYDVIGIEEATTLTASKYKGLVSVGRTAKPNWRPRVYATTNPGGVGHVWFKRLFVDPYEEKKETGTRFIPARVTDNSFLNRDYVQVLMNSTGWRLDAWYHGRWNIPAGQFFPNFNVDVHVLKDFDERCGVEWFASMDYGFQHYTVVLLACNDSLGNTYIVDEHAERKLVPQLHAPKIEAMFRRHWIGGNGGLREMIEKARRQNHRGMATLVPLETGELVGLMDPRLQEALRQESRSLTRFVAGADLFATRHDGASIASQYEKLGLKMKPAVMDRVNGWAEIAYRLGDKDKGSAPTLFIHERCRRLIDSISNLQHDPARPEDVLKSDCDEEGAGGDDAADALRYLLMTKPRLIHQVKLKGF